MGSLSEPTTAPISEPTTTPISEPTTGPISEPTTGPISEPTTAPISETALQEDLISGFDRVVKIVLLGDPGVGKTALARRISTKTFIDSNSSTGYVEFWERIVEKDEKSIKVDIWDMAGQVDAREYECYCFHSADAIVIVYDSTNFSSFDNLINTLEFVKNVREQYSKIYIVGTKYDMEFCREVSSTTLVLFSKTSKVQMFETSARSGDGVEETFMNILKYSLVSAWPPKVPSSDPPLQGASVANPDSRYWSSGSIDSSESSTEESTRSLETDDDLDTSTSLSLEEKLKIFASRNTSVDKEEPEDSESTEAVSETSRLVEDKPLEQKESRSTRETEIWGQTETASALDEKGETAPASTFSSTEVEESHMPAIKTSDTEEKQIQSECTKISLSTCKTEETSEQFECTSDLEEQEKMTVIHMSPSAEVDEMPMQQIGISDTGEKPKASESTTVLIATSEVQEISSPLETISTPEEAGKSFPTHDDKRKHVPAPKMEDTLPKSTLITGFDEKEKLKTSVSPFPAMTVVEASKVEVGESSTLVAALVAGKEVAEEKLKPEILKKAVSPTKLEAEVEDPGRCVPPLKDDSSPATEEEAPRVALDVRKISR